MSITSASTRAEVLAQYNNNLSWEGSAAKAQLALEAIRWLLVNRPQSSTHGQNTINYAILENEKTKLQEFVGEFGSSVNRVTFTRGVALT